VSGSPTGVPAPRARSTGGAALANPHLTTEWEAWGSRPEDARLGLLAVHGRNQTPDYMHALCERIGADGTLDDVAVLAPRAAESSWYPNPFMQPVVSNRPLLDQALAAMEEGVVRFEAAGIPPARVVLLGFSQGACLLSQYVLSRPRRYAALVLLTGGYIGEDGAPTEFTGDLIGTPALLRCASDDGWVPAARVEQTAAELTRLGAAVDVEIEQGSEHVVTDDSVEAARRLFRLL
jgi:phospholipase/carboxylesterase